MANAITLSASLSVSGPASAPGLAMRDQVAQSGTNYHADIISVLSASTNAIPKGGVGTVFGLIIHNLDAANSVSVSTDNANTNKICTIPAGKTCPIFYPPAAATLYWTAATAPVLCEYIMVEA